MTRTARRRWTRELPSEIDGVAIGDKGPLLLHLYDQPAGDRWVDSAIPGKLGAFDRNSGEQLWLSPCEVGYGRGFGAGLGGEGDALVLGPSTNGHRIVRMALENGELMGVGQVPAFDEAIVFEDLCVCVSARRVAAIDSRTLRVAWSYDREGERYHHIGRLGERVYVVYTQQATKRQGVLILDAKKGAFEGLMLAPSQTVIHDLAVDRGAVILLADELSAVLSRDALLEHLMKNPDADVESARGLALVAVDPQARDGAKPLWFEALEAAEDDDLPEVSIGADSGKLYLVRGAWLEVRDGMTGRALGDWTVPGLDERIAWTVCQGAGVLAEETRVSMFELPA